MTLASESVTRKRWAQGSAKALLAARAASRKTPTAANALASAPGRCCAIGRALGCGLMYFGAAARKPVLRTFPICLGARCTRDNMDEVGGVPRTLLCTKHRKGSATLMQTPEIPFNEAERLEDLHAYGVLDTASEEVFGELASLAAAICGTRFAGISFVDRDRQWFKASHGAEMPDSSRAVSVCAHAILQPEVFEVANIPSDDRFADNPILNGHPRFRFYAGSRLNSHRGNAIGMLCVLDSEPGELTISQKDALKQLAHVIMTILESRRRDRRANWEALIEGAEQPMYIKDAESMRYLAANAAGLLHANCTLEELAAHPDEFEPEGDPAGFADHLLRLRTGEPVVSFIGAQRRGSAAGVSFNVTWQLLTTKTRPVILSLVRSGPAGGGNKE